MLLFQDEIIDIKHLYTVNKYYDIQEQPGSPVARYNGKLYSYELIYVLSGHSANTFHGKAFESKTDHVIFYPKGLNNDDYTVTKIEYGSCIDFYFDTDAKLPQEALCFPAHNPDIKTAFLKAYNTWTAKKKGYYPEAMAQLYNIITMLRREHREYVPSSKLAALDAANEFLESNILAHDFDYNQLAKLCGLSYSYYKKLFVAKYGMPPVKYVTLQKIKHACELLITQKYSIAEVAEACGFENVYYFSTVFKKMTGVPPSKYKG